MVSLSLRFVTGELGMHVATLPRKSQDGGTLGLNIGEGRETNARLTTECYQKLGFWASEEVADVQTVVARFQCNCPSYTRGCLLKLVAKGCIKSVGQ